MSELQKYKPGVTDGLSPFIYCEATGAELFDAEVYLSTEVDARLALKEKELQQTDAAYLHEMQAMRERLALMRRAVDWCLTHGAKRAEIFDPEADDGLGDMRPGIRDAGCDCCSHKLEVPADLSPIICPGSGKGEGNG